MSWNVGDALGYGWARFRVSPTSHVLGVTDQQIASDLA